MFAWQRFFGTRRISPQLQSEAGECGLACIGMIAASFGHRISLLALRQRHPFGMRGATLRNLAEISRSLQLVPRSVRVNLHEVRQLRLPCVLHWNLDHFVVLERIRTRSLCIVDPAVGRVRVTFKEAAERFSGVAMEVTPAPDFSPQTEHRSLRFRDLLAGTHGLVRSLLILFAVSIALQVLVLALPFYSQLVIDEVVVRGDRDLLVLLGLSFLLLVSTQAVIAMCRAWLIVVASTRLGLDWSGRVYRHLLCLPLGFFESRTIGDIQSRFGSLASLQQLLTRQVVETVVDGLMAVTTLLVMLAYQPQLTLIVILSVLMYIVARAALFSPMRRAAQQALLSSATKEGFFLETLRGMLTVKASDIRDRCETAYMQRLVDASHDQVRLSRYSIWQLGISRVLFSVQLVVVIWMAALAVLEQQLTVGMLVAFLAYRTLFTERAAALVDKVFEFRLARVHLERLADIVMTTAESQEANVPSLPRRDELPTIAVRELHFRYAPDAPGVLQDLTFQIEPGEHVVLTGGSGAGKTTLVKLLMGLLPPTSGAVVINNVPLAQYGVRRYRSQIAAVMQDDRLFSGSLLDNITLFDPEPDIDLCRRCAGIADLDAVIDALPMRYFTPIGDMGASLSGGQKQRLLLARALYRRPSVLFLDEFTSHLDILSEQKVSQRLGCLEITRVVVAHRRETALLADREIPLNGTAPAFDSTTDTFSGTT